MTSLWVEDLLALLGPIAALAVAVLATIVLLMAVWSVLFK